MTEIDAIYQSGVFKPLGPVGLHENERVRLSVRSVAGSDTRAWLEKVRSVQQRIIAERGFFPDSATDIAADRLR
jgi:predicted DNA-binding antitoxin AbrB/MazE fold protein